MNLNEYIKSFPKNERQQVRVDLANSIGVAETTIRSWANRNRSPNYLRLDSIVKATKGKVKKRALLQEFFSKAA